MSTPPNTIEYKAFRGEPLTSSALAGVTVLLFIVFYLAHPHVWDISATGRHGVDERAEIMSAGGIQRPLALFGLAFFGMTMLTSSFAHEVRIKGMLGLTAVFFVFWLLISISWSQDMALSFKRSIVFTLLIIGAFGLSSRLSFDDFWRIVCFIALGGCIIGLIAELSIGTFHPKWSEWRFSGTIHPTQQGLNSSLVVMGAIGAARRSNRRVLWYLIAVIGFGFVLMAKSRMAMISTVGGVGTYYLLASTPRFKAVLLIGVPFVLSISLLAIPQFAMNAALMGRAKNKGEDAKSLTGRVPLWTQLIDQLEDRPLVGFGYESFWTPEMIVEVSEKQGWTISGAHNGFLEVFLALGVIGFLTFVVITVASLWRAVHMFKRTGDSQYAFIFAMIAWMCISFMLSAWLNIPGLPTFVMLYLFIHLGFIGSEVASEYRVRDSRPVLNGLAGNS